MSAGRPYPREPLRNEKGMALVAGLMLVSVLLLLGTTAIITSTTDIRISGNYRSASEAFYIAEAGIERARGELRNIGGTTLSQLLAARVGANGVLSNSSTTTSFYNNGAFVSDDVPYLAQTAFAGGTFRVYLTNDSKPPDSVTSTTDTNLQVTLTSFGQGPNGSLAVVQSVVKQLTLPPLPGAIVLPGPGVSFQGGNSNASGVDGGIASAVTLTSDASRSSVIANLTAIGRLANYTCLSPPCINNQGTTIDPVWNSAREIEELYQSLSSVADLVTGTTSGTTATTTTLTAAQVGTTTDRKIVVVNGNAILGPVNGAGVLVVTGQLTLHGNFNYNGLILCMGQGNLLRSGGGNGDITGAIVVAKTRDTANTPLPTLGNPTFNTDGGGNSDIVYNQGAASLPAGARPFTKKVWRQF